MNDLLNLKLELVRRRIRQRTLALHMGVSESYLSDVLNSIKPVSRDLIQEIWKGIAELSESKRR